MHKRVVVSAWRQVSQGKEVVGTTQDPLGLMLQGTIRAQEKSGFSILEKIDGSPDYTIIYGKTKKGLRFIANATADRETIRALITRN